MGVSQVSGTVGDIFVIKENKCCLTDCVEKPCNVGVYLNVYEPIYLNLVCW